MPGCFSTTALLLGASAFVLGCAPRDDAPRSASAGAAANEVTVTATDYALDAPDTMPAGWTTVRLVNDGEQPHAAVLLRLEAGRTVREYIEAYGEAVRTRGPRPAWATAHGGAMAIPHGEASAIVHMEAGDYAWVCFVPAPDGSAHMVQHGEAHEFVVRPYTGDAPAPSAPEPTATLRMLDYAFELDTTPRAGRQTIRVENAGLEQHHVLFFELMPERTMAEFNAWLQTGMQGEAPASLVAAMAGLSAGAEAYLEVDLTPGEYVLVCLVAGRDEVPHTAKGMIRRVRVG